nr:hypothetical protein [Tanacetum cinerariifolium]
ITLPLEAEVERLLAMPTPPPSLLTSLSPPSTRERLARDVGYGIRDTWVDPAEAVPEIAPMTLGKVNTKVTDLAKLYEHDTQDLYALLEDAQDSRTRISQRVKGNDVPTYTDHFQELTLICTKFVAETKKIDKYIGGLLDNIYESVKASKPNTLDKTIELANNLMDQKLRTYTERQTHNKRNADDSPRNNHGHQQHPSKRQNITKVYNMGSGERKPYGETCPSAQSAIFITMAHVLRNATNIT